jgi:acetylornithine deacetylase
MVLTPEQIGDLVHEIDEDRLVENLAAMVAIPSVNPFDDPVTKSCREQEFGDAFEKFLQAVGLATFRRDVAAGRPNVFGRLAGARNGPCLMLAGHLDTVGVDGYDDPFNPVVKNGRVYGRGSCDMKAALAAYVEVARVMSNSSVRLEGELLIAGVADEEHLMIGSREISRNGPIPDFAVVGEPTELKVCHTHKGQLCLPVRTYGKAVHSSVPELGVNAITHMAEVVRAFEQYGADLLARDPDPEWGRGRVNPGVIRGGTISSSVPDFCELEVDRRLLAGETCEQVVEEYRQFLESLGQSIPDFHYEIGAPTLDNAPLDTPEDSLIVTSVAEAYNAEREDSAEIGAFCAATDAPNFLCPAVICGPGSINQAHTLDEYVEIDQLTTAAKIYLRTVLNILA